MKVLLTDTYLGEPTLERDLLAEHGIALEVASDYEPETLAKFNVDGVLNCIARVPASVIEAMPRLKVIVRYGIGVDNIDASAADRRGVMVCNVPDYCVDEVATHAVAMVLDCNRQITWHHEAIRSAKEPDHPVSPRRLSTQTLGIVGLGRIGGTVCRKVQSLGLRVLGCDPHLSEQKIAELGAEPAPFDRLLKESDFVTLHVPLQDDTQGMINAESLSMMKPTAYLINTCRGKVVDMDALLKALDETRLAGAALDVFPEEPLAPESPVRRHPRVILTPHSAWYSPESLEESRRKAVGTVVEALHGKTPASLMNRPVSSL